MLRAKLHSVTGLFVAMLLAAVPAARAQEENPLCQTPQETIVTPHAAQFGAVPPVWDATYKRLDQLVQFGAGAPLTTGTVMAWGRVLKPGTYEAVETTLVELGRRGRALTLKTFKAKAGETPVDLIGDEKAGFVAASNYWGGKDGKRGLARLSWYDGKADYKSERILQDATFDYTLQRLVPADGGGFMAVVNAVNHANDADRYGIIMRFNRDGAMAWRRAYRTGNGNDIRDLARLPDGQYMAAGMSRMENGFEAGWAMKLGADGTIVWQRSYPRGAASSLSFAAALPTAENGTPDIVLLGDSRPLDDEPGAAWIMKIDGAGEPLWQRYIRRNDFTLMPLGILTEPDGRFTVALNAEGVDEKDEPQRRDHVRLFTVSPRGVLIEDEAYIDGIEAEGAAFFRGAEGIRVVIGTIQSDARVPTPTEQLAEALKRDDSDPKNAAPPPKAEEILQQGWVFLASGLDIYDDPCLIKNAGGGTPR